MIRTVLGAIVMVAVFTTSSALRGEGASDGARLGIVLPVYPRINEDIVGRVRNARRERVGPFAYVLGSIATVPVVVGLAPVDGEVVRGFLTQDMIDHYHVKAVLYPGTSGAELSANDMLVGDIVLGAENVDFGNFFMTKAGTIRANEFAHEAQRYSGLFLDPKILAPLACEASRVANRSSIPGWLNPNGRPRKPTIFYFGIQGSSTMWIARPQLQRQFHEVFHAIDEDGDWYSDLISTFYHVPFIEVSTISDSIWQFPATEDGVPQAPAGASKASVVAQRLSDRIVLDFIAHYGATMVRTRYDTFVANPFPKAAFDHPKQGAALRKMGGC